MRRHALPLAVCALLSAGCVESGRTMSPSGPSLSSSAGVTLESFAGTWRSSGATTPGNALTGVCDDLDYRLSPNSDGRSGSVTFKATCAGVVAEGRGRGTLDGDVLNWSADGVATRGDVVCPFAFANSTATLEAGGVRLVYRGTVCSVAVSGSELLRR
jgi:hypothetical protein